MLARELETYDFGRIKLTAVGWEKRSVFPDVHDAVVDSAFADLAGRCDLQTDGVVEIVLGIPLGIITHLGEPLEPDVQGAIFDPGVLNLPTIEVVLIGVLYLHLATLVALEELIGKNVRHDFAPF